MRATGVEEDARRLRVTYDAPSGSATLELRLAGRFNVHNALAVVALGEGLGLDPAAVRAGLESVEGVPGRMERIEAGQPFAVVVDYAHSPASLAGVLDLLAPIAAAGGGGLIAVFGSGGERDTAKRGAHGPDRGGALPAGRRDGRGPAGRGPRRDRRARSCAAPRPPAGGAASTCSRSRTGARPSPPPSSAQRPATSSCSRGRATRRRSCTRTARSRWDEAAEARLALAALGYGED